MPKQATDDGGGQLAAKPSPFPDDAPHGIDTTCSDCGLPSGGAERCPGCTRRDDQLREACGIPVPTVSGFGRGWWNEAIESQLAAACPGAGHGVHEAVRNMAPADAIEGMVTAQLAATHCAAMDAYGRAARAGNLDAYREYMNQANKLARTFTAGMEALNRHRGRTGQQTVRVEHVTVADGGKAVIGPVSTGGEGG